MLATLPTEINIQRHKCEPAHIGLLQKRLVIEDQGSFDHVGAHFL
jgi:hypothetical protein